MTPATCILCIFGQSSVICIRNFTCLSYHIVSSTWWALNQCLTIFHFDLLNISWPLKQYMFRLYAKLRISIEEISNSIYTIGVTYWNCCWPLTQNMFHESVWERDLSCHMHSLCILKKYPFAYHWGIVLIWHVRTSYCLPSQAQRSRRKPIKT